MSYKKRFTRRISVPYSGSTVVSYPASQSGGTKSVSYSGTAYEDVEVEIEIDTSSFDGSIDSCNDHINALTGSVVSMNSAQCLSITQNSKRVADTIIDGFFKSVKSDVSTQKMMLTQTVDSRLMLLREQEKTLLEKKEQMERDYQRTSARYEKIFADLDKELASRIHKLDQQVFDLVKTFNEDSKRMLSSDMIHTASTHAKDSGVAAAHINLAKVKDDAVTALSRIYGFLEKKAKSDATLRRTQVEGSGTDSYYVPVGYISTEEKGGLTDNKCVVAEWYETRDKNIEERAGEKLRHQEFNAPSESEKQQIVSFVQNEINTQLPQQDAHTLRVKEMINRLLAKNNL